jgi:hypothetical protein
VTYAVEASVEYPLDADIRSFSLLPWLEAAAEVDQPAITVELRDLETDTLLASRTRRGEQGLARLRLDEPVLDAGRCDTAESGRKRCEHSLIVRARTDVEARLSGSIAYTAFGGKESHSDEDPDVGVTLDVQRVGR